jgi:hypothetical protein
MRSSEGLVITDILLSGQSYVVQTLTLQDALINGMDNVMMNMINKWMQVNFVATSASNEDVKIQCLGADDFSWVQVTEMPVVFPARNTVTVQLCPKSGINLNGKQRLENTKELLIYGDNFKISMELSYQ